MHRTSLRKALPAAAALTLLALVFSAACGSSTGSEEPGPNDGNALVWEAWDQIDQSYAGREDLDLEAMVGSTLRNLLELADAPAYPFLADVGHLRGQPPPQVPPELADVWRALVLHQNKWPEIDWAEVMKATISGMVSGLGDPSTVYFTAEGFPEARESLKDRQEPSYLGIGANVVDEDGRVLLFPFSDEPADKAGVQSGDALLEVDGRPVAGLSFQAIVEMVSGPPGTEAGSKVSLLLQRAQEPEPLAIDVFRNNVARFSINYQLLPGGIGYMRINLFRDNTADLVYSALEQFDQIETLALILDMRANPGGSLAAAFGVAGHFLPTGTLFISQQEQGGPVENLIVAEDPERPALSEQALVVLIDDQTVGEAETVAAALQDAGRAVIIGTQSFGKGSSNTFVELSDGSAIYLPTSRWYRPSGQRLAGEGVEPDILVSGPDDQIARAYEHLDESLPAFR